MSDYGLLSLLPPILTVILAIWTRNILFSLGLGVFTGSMILSGYNPFRATLDMIETRIFVQISVPSNIQIIFTMMAIGGFIRLLEISGGARAFARGMTRFIGNGARAQTSTWMAGLAIFFYGLRECADYRPAVSVHLCRAADLSGEARFYS